MAPTHSQAINIIMTAAGPGIKILNDHNSRTYEYLGLTVANKRTIKTGASIKASIWKKRGRGTMVADEVIVTNVDQPIEVVTEAKVVVYADSARVDVCIKVSPLNIEFGSEVADIDIIFDADVDLEGIRNDNVEIRLFPRGPEGTASTFKFIEAGDDNEDDVVWRMPRKSSICP
jgi:hypothetical protein